MHSNLWQNIQIYFQNNLDSFLTALGEHLIISFLALVLASAIGIPCGYLCMKKQFYGKYIMGIFQVLRIIPSLAILFLLIPVLGTGLKPALTALILLAVPPILMNTAAGLQEVPSFLLETSEGLGMTERQSFWKVQFPLALPLILTGVKTAMIELIASTALAAKIGAGGLGGLIFTGLGLNRTDLLLIGGISVAILSLSAGVLFDCADKWIFQYKNV